MDLWLRDYWIHYVTLVVIMLAVTLEAWSEVNEYFEQGWEYVDSKIIEKKKGEFEYLFILEKGRNKSVIINRQRKQ